VIDLAGRRVLVTGGSRGIGAACCRLFAAAGAAVLVHFRSRRDDAEAVVAGLPAAAHPHLSCAADLARPEEIDRLFGFAAERWGGLDCLVQNAGVWERNPIAGLDVEAMERTWRIDLSAVFHCLRAAVPLFAGSPDPSVVNVSSTAGQRGEAFHSPYAASKGAMISATKSWAVELAPEIRVNAVAPGWVDTEMCAEPFAGGGRERIAAGIPLGRIASPEDVAGPILFLASPLARHVTGEILNVNGGSVLVG
jgi:3-oxoacyl-[acyl-carrier protein] reductase